MNSIATKATRHLKPIGGWLLLLAAAWLLASASAKALAPLPPLQRAASQAATRQAAPRANAEAGKPDLSLFAAVGKRNLFAATRQQSQAAPARPKAPSALNAILMGTALAQDGSAGTGVAIILYKGKQHALRPGDSVDGFVLESVARRGAVFVGNGQRIALDLDDKSSAARTKESSRRRRDK